MNFILNEKSLHGQFESADEFVESLEANLQCFRLVRSQAEGEIRKIADFYKCKITKELSLGDLKQYPKTDEMRRFRIALDKEMRTQPVYASQTIMKFRFSRRLRCFGYRKGNRFRLLRIERDHKRSNKG